MRPRSFDGADRRAVLARDAALRRVAGCCTPDEVLHYRRTLVLPAGFLPLPMPGCCCTSVPSTSGAAWRSTAHVVGEHLGGYLPFTFDVTDALRDGENELRVVVRDPSDTGHLSRGKQRLARGGIWYTPQSGIWQTVWMEAVPARWIERLEIVPDLGPEPGTPGAETLRVVVHVAPDGAAADDGAPPAVEVVVSADGIEVARATGHAGEPLVLALPGARRWSPEDPYLYDLEVRAGTDVVRSYAGIRSFGLGPDAAGFPRLLLNGAPYFHAGVLDQGYWSDGGYTAPSDDAMVHDIATMKRLGFTMLRKHIKVEPLRWYHHCDRLGMLVWQDMVNGGGTYNPAVISVPAVASRVRVDDRRYRTFARADDGRSRAVAGRDARRPSRCCATSCRWRCGCRSTRAGASSTPPPSCERGPRAGPDPDGRPRQRVA